MSNLILSEDLEDIVLKLPTWLKDTFKDTLKKQSICNMSLDDRMSFIIGLSLKNIEQKTGGPFAAGVFEIESGKLISLGVNIVEQSQCSIAHAEAVALMAAQRRLGTFNLASKDLPALELVSSAQPCIQCFGNTWWSGVRRLTFAARASDVEEITGFDEGPLPSQWKEHFKNKDLAVEVIQDIQREEACEVLKHYIDSGGLVYNPSV